MTTEKLIKIANKMGGEGVTKRSSSMNFKNYNNDLHSEQLQNNNLHVLKKHVI